MTEGDILMQVTIFSPPNGNQEVVNIKNVNACDAKWFKENNVKISMEQLNDCYVVYADIGLVVDGEPDELIVFSNGESCVDTLARLRTLCEEKKNETTT